jgi:DNA-binding beta-propeller fold protein YncE
MYTSPSSAKRRARAAALLIAVGVSICGLAPSAASPHADGLGALASLGCIENPGKTACKGTGGSTPGLVNPTDVAASGDGKNVYVASTGGSLDTFARNVATGVLSPLGCFQARGGKDCTGKGGTAPGLSGAHGVAVSADGKNVYVASAASNAVAIFRRNTSTGTLTPAGCVQSTGGTECSATASGLDRPADVVVSADGKNVYVAAFGKGTVDGAIVVFARDRSSGALKETGCIQTSGGVACGAGGRSTDGLRGANGLTASGDGKSVYVAAYYGDDVASFVRNGSTGALTPQGCFGAGPGCKATPGLARAQNVAASADGKNVYVAAAGSNAVAVFGRNRTTGALTAIDCVQNTGGKECTGGLADGLGGAAGVAVSGDGRNVYVSSGSGGGAIALFERNRTTGGLAPVGCIQNRGGTGCNGRGSDVDGIYGPDNLTVSGDGRNVYAVAYTGSSIAEFARTAPPSLTNLSVRPARFAVGSGTTFAYTLSEPASVTFTIQRKVSATRFNTVGRMTRQGAIGANRTFFSGKIGNVRLSPGSYRATVVATDQTALRSDPRSVGFTILRR